MSSCLSAFPVAHLNFSQTNILTFHAVFQEWLARKINLCRSFTKCTQVNVYIVTENILILHHITQLV